jgi:pimeloyl-ACP methyl ester carboxylesterase
VPELAKHFHVFRPDRRGHGRSPDVEGPITYALMAQDTIAFLEQVVGGPASLLGHSDGAPVALLAALERPDLVRKLVLSAGVFHHHGWAPGAIDLDDETIAFFTDYWGAVAPDGPDHFPVVKAKLDRMHREEPTLTVADLAGYPGPALVMVGDSDEEIPIEHTLALRRGLPNAQLAVLPGTGHGAISMEESSRLVDRGSGVITRRPPAPRQDARPSPPCRSGRRRAPARPGVGR